MKSALFIGFLLPAVTQVSFGQSSNGPALPFTSTNNPNVNQIQQDLQCLNLAIDSCSYTPWKGTHLLWGKNIHDPKATEQLEVTLVFEDNADKLLNRGDTLNYYAIECKTSTNGEPLSSDRNNIDKMEIMTFKDNGLYWFRVAHSSPEYFEIFEESADMTTTEDALEAMRTAQQAYCPCFTAAIIPVFSPK